MTDANTRGSFVITSSWGYYLVRRHKNSGSIEVFTPEGGRITKATNRKGKGERVEPKEYEQASLFGTNDQCDFSIDGYTDVFVPSAKWKAGEKTSKGRIAMDKETKGERL